MTDGTRQLRETHASLLDEEAYARVPRTVIIRFSYLDRTTKRISPSQDLVVSRYYCNIVRIKYISLATKHCASILYLNIYFFYEQNYSAAKYKYGGVRILKLLAVLWQKIYPKNY